MKAHLSERGATFEERNVKESTQYVRELIQHQSRSTPTLIVGDQVLIGFDPEQIDRAIGFKS